MNKFLLFSLILLLGVLAFGIGLFSNDKSATLSQYVPDSVGQLFSKTTDNKTPQDSNSLNKQSFPALVMPDYSKSNVVGNKTEKIETRKPASEGISGISGALIQELQQEFTPDMNSKSLQGIKSNMVQVDAESKLLKVKLDALSTEFNNRSAVLDQIEKQIKKLNN